VGKIIMVVYIQVLRCTPPLQLCPQWTCSHLVRNGVVYFSARSDQNALQGVFMDRVSSYFEKIIIQ